MVFLKRRLIFMLLFLALFVGGCGTIHSMLWHIFSHNYVLNSLIFGSIFSGVGLALYQLIQLIREQSWLDSYENGKERFPGVPTPRILAPLNIALNDASASGGLSAVNSRVILASVESRLEEMREVSRYLVGLLIFLGLLGTFWGLSKTISAIAGVIGGLDLTTTDMKEAIDNLKHGLQQPLGGMGTAFSCSLFGLTGSLLVGFLDFHIGKSSAHFFQSLEERLSQGVRFGSGGDALLGSGPAFSSGLLEQSVEAMANLHAQMRQSEENRISVVRVVQSLTERLVEFNDQTNSHQNIIRKIAQNQVDLQDHVREITKTLVQIVSDDMSKQHLRSIDITLNKVLEEMIKSFDHSTQEMKQEIRVIGRTLSALASGHEGSG